MAKCRNVNFAELTSNSSNSKTAGSIQLTQKHEKFLLSRTKACSKHSSWWKATNPTSQPVKNGVKRMIGIPIEDKTGKRFGKLTALKYLGKSYWLCKCDCGNFKKILSKRLKQGIGLRCKDCFNRSKQKHNLSKHPIYKVWLGINSRCYSKNTNGYKRYGGKGIIMCKEWKEHPDKFISWALANGYRPGLQLDRINNNGDYQPSNCRFITPKENTNRQERFTTNYISERKKTYIVLCIQTYNLKYLYNLTTKEVASSLHISARQVRKRIKDIQENVNHK